VSKTDDKKAKPRAKAAKAKPKASSAKAKPDKTEAGEPKAEPKKKKAKPASKETAVKAAKPVNADEQAPVNVKKKAKASDGGKGKPAKVLTKQQQRKLKAKADDREAEAMEAAEKVRKPKKVKPGSALVIVESPAKAKTIGKYLGPMYVVKASVGHVRDLRKKDGVDIENGFEPTYEVIEGKKKVVAEIRKAARENEIVYLASDPDREGEAIAWHLSEEIKDVNTNFTRILINEITKKGVTEALKSPRPIDMNLTDAQQARRILDRLVGFQISPILWEKVQRGLSAGRVQSVAVRLVCEREEEIKAFKPEEYWTVETTCVGPKQPPFEAKVIKWHGEKAGGIGVYPQIKDEADAIAAELAAGPAVVTSVERKERAVPRATPRTSPHHHRWVRDRDRPRRAP